MARVKLENLQVLIVDDSAYMRELLSSVLHAFGVREIRVAESALEATQQLTKFQANVAIIDWMMTPVNGIELVKHLRHSTIDRYKLLPIIMLTGHTDKENIDAAKEVGVNSFLGKPFTPNSLYDQIAHILENPDTFLVETSDTPPKEPVGKPVAMLRR